VSAASPANQETPTFSFRVAVGGQPALDAQTGTVKPGDTATESFRMDGVVVHRAGDQPPRPLVAARSSQHHQKSHRKRHK
jgi:hypothetical protein